VERFEPEPIEAALSPILERREVTPGTLYQPIRVAISGGSVSPGIFDSLATLGRERSLERIERAVERLRASAQG
jgi:glutamyl/glutaminyl-tRNA synthetase